MHANRILQLALVLVLALAPALLGVAHAGAATVQQDTATAVVPGIYRSETLPAADSPGREYTLGLFSDGSAIMTTDFLNDETPIEEFGAWVQDEAGNVVVALTGTAEREYEQPVEITFAVDGATLQTVPDDPNYGAEGLTLALAESEDEALGIGADVTADTSAGTTPVAGTYISKPFEAGNISGMGLLHLAEDGTALGLSIALASEAPGAEIGTWSAGDDGTVTVTLTESVAVGADGETVTTELDEPSVAVLEIGDAGELGNENIVLYPADSLGYESSAGEIQTLVYVSEVLPSADTAGRVVSLALSEEGTAALATDYMNDEAPVVELGTWEEIAEGEILVILEGTEATPYEQPEEIVFASADGTLTATEYNPERYGEEGLTLTLAPDENGAAMPAIGEVETITYQSEIMPSAASPGVQVTMVFGEDGSFQAVSDYQDGETVIVEVGTWMQSDDGTVTVVVTGTESEVYDQPTEFTVEEQEDGSLLAVNPVVFGDEGLSLTLLEE